MKEGDLLKVCNGGPRRYKFVLFSDMLVYGTETMRAKFQRDHRKYKVGVDPFLCVCVGKKCEECWVVESYDQCMFGVTPIKMRGDLGCLRPNYVPVDPIPFRA